MNDLENIFTSFKNLKIGVVGDVMLDTYIWGNVERISPEAPVPVVSLQKKEYRIGGAGNVGLNLNSLNINSFVLSVIGKDEDAVKLESLLNSNNISTKYLLKNEDRLTTSKTRIISKNQQMMRLDAEVVEDLDKNLETDFLKIIQEFVEKEKPHAIIFEDYNKGILTVQIIQKTIELCRNNNVIIAVDPKRKNFFEYKNVHIFKPNLKEVKDGLNILSDDISISSLENIHSLLKENINHLHSLITLSEHGVFYNNEEKGEIIPSHFRKIADVSGAGDTVIAVATAVYSISKDIKLSAQMANIAGGLVCEIVGTASINANELLEECKKLIS
jgi:rfaE bifunctional protein kinase chain/domain